MHTDSGEGSAPCVRGHRVQKPESAFASQGFPVLERQVQEAYSCLGGVSQERGTRWLIRGNMYLKERTAFRSSMVEAA